MAFRSGVLVNNIPSKAVLIALKAIYRALANGQVASRLAPGWRILPRVMGGAGMSRLALPSKADRTVMSMESVSRGGAASFDIAHVGLRLRSQAGRPQ